MTANIDILSGIFCFVAALACFAIHVITAPGFARHHPLPEAVRIGFFFTGAMLMFRAVDFGTLSGGILMVRGHGDVLTVLTGGVLCYTLVGLAFSLFLDAKIKLSMFRVLTWITPKETMSTKF